MIIVRLLLLPALLLNYAVGQINFSPRPAIPASGAKYQVKGNVVNALTGEPIRRALVSLKTGEGQEAAFSDDSGAFTLENVPEGMYGVRCTRPGFSGTRNRVNWTQIHVTAQMPPVTLKLMPMSSIAGRVLDEQGSPVDGISVQVLMENIRDGRITWIPGTAAATDEDGSYEISNLVAGTYRLRLESHPGPPQAGPTPVLQANLPVTVYPSQYFPQGSDPAGAQAITLGGGQTYTADFTVRAVPGYQVRGVATPAAQNAFIRLEDTEGNNVGMGARVGVPRGRFLLAGVPPGTWKVVGQTFTPAEQLWGEQEIRVTNSDVANVTVAMEPLAKIPLVISNAPAGGAPGVQATLVRQDAEVMQGWRGAEYGATDVNHTTGGTSGNGLHFENVLPGRYFLRIHSWGTTCVDSVRYGNSDVQTSGITVNGGESTQPIEISLRSDCASVAAKVNLSQGVQMGSILIRPEDTVSMEPVLNHFAGEAAAQISGLTPGTYKLYAFDTVDGLEYANPEVLNGFPGTEVTLAPNQKAELTLDLIRRMPEGNVPSATQ